MDRKKSIIKDFIFALITSLAIFTLLEIAKDFFPLVLISFYMLYRSIRSHYHYLNNNGKAMILFSLFSAYFAFIITFGYKYWENNKLHMIEIIVSMIGLFILAYKGLTVFYKKTTCFLEKYRYKRKEINVFQNFWFWVISIFICWIPVFMIYYPAIISSDTTKQWREALGINPFSDHHPITHTMLILLAQHISDFISGGNELAKGYLAASVYSFIQMCIMSCIFGYVLYQLYKSKMPSVILVLSWLYYAVFPLNSMFSIYITKDVLFSGFVLLLTCLLKKIIYSNGEYLKKVTNVIKIMLLMALILLFRSNGFLITYSICILLAVVYTKCWKQILIIMLGILLVQNTEKMMLNYYEVESMDVKEALGMPINQVALVVIKAGSLTEKEKELIEAVLPIEEIKSLYDPHYSDPIKFSAEFNSDIIEKNKFIYLRLWVTLMCKYPMTCLEASANLTIGYWYPGVKKGAISSDLSIKKELFERIDIHKYSDNHLLDRFYGTDVRNSLFESWVWSIGLMVLFMFYLCMICVLKKGNKMIFIFLPNMIVWGTMLLASPSYCETRYVYSIFIALPIYISLLFDGNLNKEDRCLNEDYLH